MKRIYPIKITEMRIANKSVQPNNLISSTIVKDSFEKSLYRILFFFIEYLSNFDKLLFREFISNSPGKIFEDMFSLRAEI